MFPDCFQRQFADRECQKISDLSHLISITILIRRNVRRRGIIVHRRHNVSSSVPVLGIRVLMFGKLLCSYLTALDST